jgi:four helix bundle protein
MAKYQRFEEVPAWQAAAELYNRVLDLFEEPNVPVTGTFRNQMERAALSVSNNIAEGFERSTTGELVSFLAIGRGSAGEVRSMVAVVKSRPKLGRHAVRLEEIGKLADSCVRQLNAWSRAVEEGSFQGKRRPGKKELAAKVAFTAAKDYRVKWLKGLKPEHPLYNSAEAKEARGETVEE